MGINHFLFIGGLISLIISSGLMYSQNEFAGFRVRRGFTTLLFFIGLLTYIFLFYNIVINI